MSAYTEDTLVQQTAADYLHDQLGWDVVYAYNEETFGPEGTLGRKSDREVVLTRYLGEALVKLNPGLPMPAYQEAIRRITEYSVTHSTLQINMEKYELLKNGVLVDFRNENGEPVKRRLRVFDFDKPKNNHFLAVRVSGAGTLGAGSIVSPQGRYHRFCKRNPPTLHGTEEHP